jgi:hypothetical protein
MNQQIKNLNDSIAMKKADVQIKLDLATKQFDMNSQSARDALDRFNTLLSSGALDSASGQDIANLTLSTGLSSQAIQSAISANKKKNLNTTVSTASDDTGQYSVVINSDTGEIIAKTKIAEAESDTKNSLTPTQEREIISKARKVIIEIDDNEDKLLSANEYINAVNNLITETGVDDATAEKYIEEAFRSLGYSRWKW